MCVCVCVCARAHVWVCLRHWIFENCIDFQCKTHIFQTNPGSAFRPENPLQNVFVFCILAADLTRGIGHVGQRITSAH